MKTTTRKIKGEELLALLGLDPNQSTLELELPSDYSVSDMSVEITPEDILVITTLKETTQ